MIIKFNCKCRNNDPSKAYDYHGILGYENIVCKICGMHYDYMGEHEKDTWSENYMIKTKKIKI
jgi:hypothetical protein